MQRINLHGFVVGVSGTSIPLAFYDAHWAVKMIKSADGTIQSSGIHGRGQELGDSLYHTLPAVLRSGSSDYSLSMMFLRTHLNYTQLGMWLRNMLLLLRWL